MQRRQSHSAPTVFTFESEEEGGPDTPRRPERYITQAFSSCYSRARGALVGIINMATSIPRAVLLSPAIIVGFIGNLLLKLVLRIIAVYERYSVKNFFVTRVLIPFLGVYAFFHWWRISRPQPTTPLALLTVADCKPYRSELLEESTYENEGSLQDVVRAASGGAGRLIIASSNTSTSVLAANWLLAVKDLRPAVPGVLIAAGDALEASRLTSGGVSTYLMDAVTDIPLPKGASVAGARASASSTWQAASLRKWASAHAALTSGLDVLIADVDALPLRNPLSYIDTLPGCDSYFTTDATYLYPSSDVWYPKAKAPWWAFSWSGAGGGAGAVTNYISSGFAYLRSNTRTIELVESVIRITAALLRDPSGAAGVREYDRVGLTSADGAADSGSSSGGEGAGSAGDSSVPVVASTAGGVTISSSSGHPLDSEESVLNAVLQRLYERDYETSHPVPKLEGRSATCANYGKLSFYVLSPYLFQGSTQFKLTDVVHEPPFMRHFNFVTPPPPGTAVSASTAVAGRGHDGLSPATDVSLPEKIAYMKDFSAWAVEDEQEKRLMCRGVLAEHKLLTSAAAGDDSAE